MAAERLVEGSFLDLQRQIIQNGEASMKELGQEEYPKHLPTLFFIHLFFFLICRTSLTAIVNPNISFFERDFWIDTLGYSFMFLLFASLLWVALKIFKSSLTFKRLLSIGLYSSVPNFIFFILAFILLIILRPKATYNPPFFLEGYGILDLVCLIWCLILLYFGLAPHLAKPKMLWFIIPIVTIITFSISYMIFANVAVVEYLLLPPVN
jgi:hypothetical protein